MSVENPQEPEGRDEPDAGGTPLQRKSEGPARKATNRYTAKKLRNMRQARSLTLEALSIAVRERTGVAIEWPRISRYERNLMMPSPAELWALAKYFGVGLAWLCDPNDKSGTERREPEPSHETNDWFFISRITETIGTAEAIRRLSLSEFNVPPPAQPAAGSIRPANPNQRVKPDGPEDGRQPDGAKRRKTN
jgi:transcriptional regulator with XRE-family HTH domain